MDKLETDRVPNTAASSPTGGGCLRIYLLLPAFVLVVCILLANVAMDVGFAHGVSLEEAGLNESSDMALAAFFTPKVKYWEDDIYEWALEWNLDANLIATVMQIESCGDPQAISYAGAMGLFQVMPFHFVEGENPDDPQINARRGLGYLKKSMEAANGNVTLALLGYNAGISTITKPRSSWPAQGNRYIYWGASIYIDATRGLGNSSVLHEWLQNGGQHLCNQAEERQMISP